MNAAVPTTYFLGLIEAALRAGPWNTAKMGLFTGNPTLNRLTVLADLAALEPTYTGYARQAMVLNTLEQNANGDLIDSFISLHFQPTANTALPQTITGYFITNTVTAVDHLIAAEKFDAGIVFADDTRGFDILIKMLTQNNTIYGGAAYVG